MALLKDFINLLFYGNFWIAFCALAMVLQSQWLLDGSLAFRPIIGLLFFATLFLYALHRIVGISRLKDFLEEERYSVIYRYRHHIRFYAFVGFIGSLYFFLQISWAIRWELIVPALLSLAYVWPILSKRRRLRDINHLKIYLIALVWAWVCVRLPFVDAGRSSLELPQSLLLVEKALFIFAITLPFDIRDLVVDQYSKVKTIPSIIGLARSKYLAYAALFVAFLLVCFNPIYTSSSIIALAISYASTAWFVSHSDSQKHDYFFTGLIDGTMIIQLGLLVLLSYITG